MPEPRITVIGAGPVGTLLAAALAQRGLRIDWVVRNAERRRTAARQKLSWAGQQYQIPLSNVRIVADATDVTAPNWLVLAVKAQHVAAVLAEYSDATATQRLVVANGLVAGAFHLGLLYGGAYLEADTLVASPANRLVIGPLPDAAGDAQELGALLEAPWLDVDYDAEIELRQWHKLALNCAVNPLTSMLDCKNRYLLDHVASPLVQSVLAETCQLAERRFGPRWVHKPASLTADLTSLLEATADNSSSMRQDFQASRETEIELMNLALAHLGSNLGCPCPVNALLGNMICLLANSGAL